MIESAIPSETDNGAPTARFNLFQRLVRQWEEYHPYNGVQFMQIRGAVDINLSRQAWQESMEVLGLGRVSIVGGGYSHHRLNGDSAQHTVELCEPGTTVENWAAQELNRPFCPKVAVPFRPFVIQEKDFYWLGLAYQHWIADSASIRMVLHEWFVRQYDRPRASSRPLRLWAGGYLSLFGPHRAGGPPCEVLLSSLRWQSQFRRARRIEDKRNFRNMEARFLVLPAAEGMIDRLRLSARAAGVTVNDFIIAAIAESCNRHIAAPRRNRRQDLQIGSIVDLRGKVRQPLDDVFDLILGFTSVACRPSHLKNWDTLLHAVTSQTHRQKVSGAPQASWIRMLAGVMTGKLLSRDKMIDFYRKRVSLAGANSNVNANNYWPLRYHPDLIQSYIRAAPTGPMTPLVLSTTTLGSGVGIGLTYRSAILPPQKAADFGGCFMNRLHLLAR